MTTPLAKAGYVQHVQASFVVDQTFLTAALQLRHVVLAPFLSRLNDFGNNITRVQLVKNPSTPSKPLAIIEAAHDLDAVSLDGLDTLLLHSNTTLPSMHEQPPPPPTIMDWVAHRALLPAYHQLVVVVSTRHSNVVSLSISPPFLVAYVHHKGYVPWGEHELPSHIGGCRVKVAEGRCHWASIEEYRRRMDPIVSGASIHSAAGGTLGWYAPPPVHKFLTCAHVIDANVPIQQPTPHEWKLQQLREPPGLVARLFSTPPSSIAAGNVSNSHYGPLPVQVGDQIVDAGVDTALCCANDDRRWSSLVEMEHPSTGELLTVDPRPIDLVRDYEVITDVRTVLVKRGKTTGVTLGRLTSVSGVVFSHPSRAADLLRHTAHNNLQAVEDVPPPLQHQYEIIAASLYPSSEDNSVFAAPGDSGAMVFLLPPQSTRMRPFALLHAVNSAYNYTYATPIEFVQQALSAHKLF